MLIAGCGAQPEAADDTVGGRLPVYDPDQPMDVPWGPVHGVHALNDDGCQVLELADGTQRWLVWPPDFTYGQQGEVLPATGDVVDVGATIDGIGADVEAAALPEWRFPNSRTRQLGGYCSAQKTGVVVLASLSDGAG